MIRKIQAAGYSIWITRKPITGGKPTTPAKSAVMNRSIRLALPARNTVCSGCNSGYYSDEDLCRECRSEITPEEERIGTGKESAETLAEQCACNVPGILCELTDEDHRFIEKIRTKNSGLTAMIESVI